MVSMGKLLQSFYLHKRFFLYWSGVVILFCLAYAFPFLFVVAQIALMVLLGLVFLDIFMLFMLRKGVDAQRHLLQQLSLGDENYIRLRISNLYKMPVSLRVIDELPYQLQIRDFEVKLNLAPFETREIQYSIQPEERGKYEFYDVNLYASSILKLIERRVIIPARVVVKVYPSVLQMRKYELQVFSKTAIFQGIKKVRRIGNNNEFEQIRNYVQGDDIRTINWKATSRQNDLMVNQYQEERAQQVYCIIDKGRAMRMPFEQLSLLDYAINSTLTLSNIILRKGDKAGVITFSDKIGTQLYAESKTGQLRKIMDVLYHQKTQFMEANFERLYYSVKTFIKGRSMLLLFTNFESMYALERNLPLLRKLNQQHLLVVVFFQNTELEKAAHQEAKNVKDVYFKSIAQKMAIEKKLIVQELQKYGIQSILTKPQDLSVNTINKYLEIKSKGMI
jgi:uncharacterized protein (DUF58 family)